MNSHSELREAEGSKITWHKRCTERRKEKHITVGDNAPTDAILRLASVACSPGSWCYIVSYWETSRMESRVVLAEKDVEYLIKIVRS